MVKLYADDTNLFIFNQDITILSITANEYLSHLCQWFVANKLSLNLDKTCLITFGTQREYKFDIKIGTVKITNVDHYLGVYTDRDLKWTEHSNQLYKKCLIMLVFSIGLDKDCLINVSRVFILHLSIHICFMA